MVGRHILERERERESVCRGTGVKGELVSLWEY